MAEIIITEAKTDATLVIDRRRFFDGKEDEIISKHWEGEITLKFVSNGDCTGITRESIQGTINYALRSSTILI